MDDQDRASEREHDGLEGPGPGAGGGEGGGGERGVCCVYDIHTYILYDIYDMYDIHDVFDLHDMYDIHDN